MATALPLLFAASTLIPRVDPEALYDAQMIAKAPEIAVPAGFGRYCSLTYPDGGWAFDWGSATADPCATMLASSPGGKIARAGLYSMNGANNIVRRCGGEVGLFKVEGSAGVQTVFDEAKNKKSCVFTLAPKTMQILHAPYTVTEDSVSYTNLFDFARGYDVTNNLGGQSANLNYKGVGVNYTHDGFDWPMDAGTMVRAVHKGVVLLARDRDVTAYCKPATPLQKEAYVLHKVGSGVYAELFVSYYAHFKDLTAETGDTVVRGEMIGTVGSTGCSSGPHLHFELNRMSNLAASYRRHLRVPATEDYPETSPIDPYGFSWAAKAGFDPWAWRAFDQGRGALSISMWVDGQRPPRD